MNRILFYPHEITQWQKDHSDISDNKIVLEIPAYDYRVQHIKHILKASDGKILQSGIIGENKGQLYIEHISESSIECIYTSNDEQKHRPLYNIHLILGHLRPPVMARVIKDMCGIGVASIFVHNADLTEKSYMNASIWNETDKLRLLGAMQGGLIFLPHIACCYNIEDAIQKQANFLSSLALSSCATPHTTVLKIVCDKDYNDSYIDFIHAQLTTHPQEEVCLVLCIGAERGYTERERVLIERNQFVGLSMGDSILRSEVAIHIATGIITSLL